MFGVDARAARVVWTVLLFAIAVTLLYVLRHVLALAAFGLVFAYLVSPLVRFVQSFRLLRHRRPIAIGLVYLVLLGALVGAGLAVAPRLKAETSELAKKVPQLSQRLEGGDLASMLERRGWDAGRARDIDAFLKTHAQSLAGYVQTAVTAVLAWLAGAWTIVLIPIFAFFFLKDGDRFATTVEAMIESRAERRVWRGVVNDVHRLLGEYVCALILLCALTFVVWTTLFYFAGVPYALLLAALGGTLEFIPVVGPVVAGITVMAVSLFAGYPHPWLLLGFLVAWRLVQDYGSSPLVMGSGVELHPALVIFGVIAGGEIAGVAGMFLSIPVMAALRIVWRRVHTLYQVRTTTTHASTAEPGELEARRPRQA